MSEIRKLNRSMAKAEGAFVSAVEKIVARSKFELDYDLALMMDSAMQAEAAARLSTFEDRDEELAEAESALAKLISHEGHDWGTMPGCCKDEDSCCDGECNDKTIIPDVLTPGEEQIAIQAED